MGLYIKGVEMPTSCQECPLKHRGFNGSETVHYCYAICKEVSDGGEIDADCPLIHITEHGRLIDVDALMLKILDYIEEYSDVDEKGWHNLKWCAMKEAEMAINDAPTIIPAEPPKEVRNCDS